ncbi:hypothetical protein F5X96DRAFT_653232 [Biscogniauxia mediterranea]|nr:hypothetical protein F5X96DRAFT_653232 [Biscogniauxia mediterranea]
MYSLLLSTVVLSCVTGPIPRNPPPPPGVTASGNYYAENHYIGLPSEAGRLLFLCTSSPPPGARHLIQVGTPGSARRFGSVGPCVGNCFFLFFFSYSTWA